MSGYFSRKTDAPDTEPFRRFYAEGGYVDTPEGYAGGGPIIKNLLKKVTEPLRAWHGTPHNVDKFDSTKIGTGEGVQAYGHGLYFAENPEVAKSYQTALAGKGVDPLDVTSSFLPQADLTPENVSAIYSAALDLDKPADAAARAVQARIRNLRDPDTSFLGPLGPRGVSIAESIDALRKRHRGNLYEVNLKVPRDALLSWDTPLREQQDLLDILRGSKNSAVRDSLDNLDYAAPTREVYGKDIGPVSGADFYHGLSYALTGTPAHRKTSATLMRTGIPGVQYLDQGSRGMGGGSHNYVMFPGTEDLIEIVGRYAEGGYVDDTSHDIDDVDAGLYGSQYFAEGGPVADEDWGAYVSQYFDEGGQVEPEGYANGGLIRQFLEKVTSPLKAWHGTPHNIDKFDAAKIGTGEGAQVYGHGLYFAENPEVAKWYRETLSGEPTWQFKDSIGNVVDKEFLRSQMSRIAGFDGDKTLLDAIEGRVKDFDPQPSHNIDTIINGILAGESPDYYLGRFTRGGYNYDAAVNHLVDNYSVEATKPGNLYEVGLHAPRNTLLSWDEPLSRQPEPVIEALDRFGIKPDIQGLRDYDDALLHNLHAAPGKGRPLPKLPLDPTGAQIYERPELIGSSFREPAATSEALLEAGIPGIRYRDGMSRGRGEAGTHNYVMFPGTEDLIEILGRYAEGGQVDEDAPPRGYFANGGLVKQLLRAFHGSPAKFDAFAADKIGSAYGGSAQGAGHYFSESEDIAKKYARPDRVEGSPGYMYEVDLNVAPESLLAFDEPFSRQSGNIQDALSRLPVADVSERELLDKFLASDLAKAFPNMSDVRAARWAAEGDSHDVMEWASRNGVPGRAAYNIVGGYGPLGAESLGRDFISRHGRETIQALDIPGLRYVDQESGPLSGATNYVMFPGTENLINLRRRYAEGGEVKSRGYFGGC